LPDSQRALLLITGAGVAFVVAAFCAQQSVSLPAVALPAVARTMGLAFLQFRPGELAAEQKARRQCPSCGYDRRCNVSGVCPERGGQT